MCDCCTKCVETPLQMSEKSSKTEVHSVLKTSDSIQQLQNMRNASITPQKQDLLDKIIWHCNMSYFFGHNYTTCKYA